MPSSRLSSISIQGYRSIKDIEVQFPEKGLFLVSAKNLDTGGSSGAGKSSFLQALQTAFDCGSFPSTETQTWDADKPSRIEVRYTSGSDTCSVVRSTRSSIKINDCAPITASKPLGEALRRTLGVGPEVLMALSFVPQDGGEDFLSMANAEKQSFLAKPLGLEDLEAAAKSAQTTANALAQRAVMLQVELDSEKRGYLEKSAEVAELSAKLENFPLVSSDEVEACEKQISDLEDRAEAFSASVSKVRALQVAAVQEAESESAEALRAAQLRALDLDATSSSLRDLKASSFAPPEVLSELASYSSELQGGREMLATVRAADAAAELKHRNEVSALSTMLGASSAKLLQVPRLEKELAALLGEISVLKSAKCPTCSRQWDEASKKVEGYLIRAESISEQLRGLFEVRARISELTKERDEKTFTHDPLVDQLRDAVECITGHVTRITQQIENAKNLALTSADQEARAAAAEVRRLMSEAEAAGAVARAPFESEIKTLREESDALRSAISVGRVYQTQLQISISKSIAQKEALADQLARTRVQLTSAHARLESKAKELGEVQLRVAQELDFARLIGREGFMGAIFEEVLQEISDETNARLAQVANVAHVTVMFVPEVKEGSATREIKAVVRVGGKEAPLRSGCSGGMISSVRLACRLAIRAVLARRAGCHLGWLTIDEGFGGIDDVSKESCLELLAEEAKDTLVIVVDHSSEFKAMFQESICLEYEKGITRLASVSSPI